jgi:hypothetical protein
LNLKRSQKLRLSITFLKPLPRFNRKMEKKDKVPIYLLFSVWTYLEVCVWLSL